MNNSGYDVNGDATRIACDEARAWRRLARALLGKSPNGRGEIVEEAGWGTAKGLRSGNWKFISTKNPQLYDLSVDVSESKNLASERPDLVEKFSKRLKELIAE